VGNAALALVGSEMVDPRRPDANGPFARERLAELGIPVTLLVRVEDKEEAIAQVLRTALTQCDLVVTSGGLGPTGDDLTREGAALLLGRRVVEDPEWVRYLEARLASRGRVLDGAGRRQAHVVEGGEALPNSAGLACGCWLEVEGKALALLPGVPSEFRSMLAEQVLPRLRARFPNQPSTRILRAVAAGLPEVDVERTLKPWYRVDGVDVSILPSRGVHRLTFTLWSPPAPDLDRLQQEIAASLRDGLGKHLVSTDGTSLEQALGERLLSRGRTVAVAESCTGGLLGQKIVCVPGASRYFLGGITAYDNKAKRALLGVPAQTLEEHGAVSRETALAMARGARARFNASCAMATTGIAGPTGGTEEKPAGTVWIASATPEGERAIKIFFPLDRESVMEFSAHTALFLLWSDLGREPEGAGP
jgi:nicotinamide-nucleotide amidase